MTTSHESTVSHEPVLPTSVLPASTPATMSEDQAQEVIRQASRHWGVLLSLGILLGGLGVAVMVWPQQTIVVVAALMGIALLVSGVFSIVGGFTAPDQSTASRVLMTISGVLSIALGLVAFRSVAHAAVILALLVGLGWLMRGIVDLVNGISSAKGTPGRGFVIAGGVVGLLFGLAVLVWPAITLTALIWVSGFWLVVLGLLQVFASFKLRGLARSTDASHDGPRITAPA